MAEEKETQDETMQEREKSIYNSADNPQMGAIFW